MILLELFWNFLVIGAVSFGGGYGMISLVRETVLGHGWLTESEFLSFIAVSESTPGPLAVNMAPLNVHRNHTHRFHISSSAQNADDTRTRPDCPMPVPVFPGLLQDLTMRRPSYLR